MVDKIKGLEELKDIIRPFGGRERKVAFTNGCFDILHVGHLRYLQDAKELGDILVVGVNSDSCVQRLKGPKRPLVPENERMEMLAGLECIDYVVKFEESTPERLIAELKPDVHVKGGDYKVDDLPEAKIVKEYGGEVKVVREVKGSSTTNLVQVIIERYSK